MTKAQKLYQFKKKNDYYNDVTSERLRGSINYFERHLIKDKRQVKETEEIIKQYKKDYKALKKIEEE